MKVIWTEKDLTASGIVVRKIGVSELAITGWRNYGDGQQFGVISLSDGMFIDVGHTKAELADWLTKYRYVPYRVLTRVQGLIQGA